MHRRGTWCTMVILNLQMGKLPGDGTLGIKLTKEIKSIMSIVLPTSRLIN
jgi:hypothetical protein